MIARDYSRLPRWAQDEINLLRMRRDELMRENDHLRGDPGEGLVFWNTGMSDSRILPPHATVVFRVNGSEVRVRLRQDDGDSTVDINANRQIRILPRAGNSCWIAPEEQ